ncbi:MAG: hypothetical protein ISP68_04795 [Flavobacteriaceae bacterium]|nr:hypothetical protein [Flavobacteriaceae bacterium]
MPVSISNIKLEWFTFYVIITFLTCLIPFVHYVDSDTYFTIVREDGGIESFTAIGLLVGSILTLRRLVSNCKALKITQKIGLGMFAFVLFLGFGEEVSWGQRIFNIESPEFFTKNNLQNETNIHNLNVCGIKLNKWIFTYGMVLVFTLYLIMPFLSRRYKWIKALAHNYSILLPTFRIAMVFLVATIVLHIIKTPKVSELWEFVFALTILSICANPYLVQAPTNTR